MAFRTLRAMLAVSAALAVGASPAPASPPAAAETAVTGYHAGSNDTGMATVWRPAAATYVTVGSGNAGATADWRLEGSAVATPGWDGGYNDLAWSAAVDATNDFFIVGGEEGKPVGGPRGRIRRYDNLGTFTGNSVLWDPAIEGSTSAVYSVRYATVMGKAYFIAGGSYGVAKTESAAALYRYYTNFNNPNGYQDGGAGVDGIRDIAIDEAGNGTAFGVGHIYTPGQGYDWLLMQVEISSWVPASPALSPNDYNSPANGDDFARAVAYQSGFVYVAGSETRSDLGTGRDWRVQKWDATFLYDPEWTATMNGAADGDDEPLGMGVLSSGTVIVVGYVDRSDVAEGKNWIVRRYDNNGLLLGESEYDSPSHGDDYARSVFVNGTKVEVVGDEDRSDIGQGRNWRRVSYDVPASLPYLDASARVSNADPVPGETVTVQLTVTATKGGFTGLTPGMRVYAGGPVLVGGPTPATLASLGAGSSATFVWTYSVTAAGQCGFTARVLGTDAVSTYQMTVRAHAEAGSLAARIAVPPVLVRGQLVSVTVYASNTGLSKVLASPPAISVATPGATLAVMSGPVPAVAVTLTPGGQQAFVWTFTVSGAGSALLSVSVTGTCASPRTAHLRALAVSATTIPQAALAFGLAQTGGAVSSTVLAAGQWFSISCTVTNTGVEAVSALTPAIQWNAGGSLVTLVSGPGAPAALAGGASRLFSWTYSTAGTGVVAYTVTASGTAAVTGAAVSAAGHRIAEVVAPGRLSAALTLSPTGSILKGKPFLVVLTVSNTGDAPVTGLSPAFPVQFTKGIGTTDPGGPVISPSAVTALAPGETVSFSYTCSAISVGLLTVRPAVTGVESVSGAAVSAAASGNLIALAKAEFSGEVIVSPSPALLVDRITVTYRVTNMGQYAALSVVPAITVLSGGSLLQQVSGPTGVGGTLNPETTRDYVWTYRVLGTGSASFLAAVSGQDNATFDLIDDTHLPIGQRSAGVAITRLEDTNLPDPGTFHIRNGVIRIKEKSSATIVLRGKGGEGEVELFVFSRAGLPLGRIGTGAVPLSAAGLAIVPFDGTVDGKALATGMYWIIARGALATRERVVIVNE